MNKLQFNIKRNSCIFSQDNAFENVVCETATILSRPQCVNMWRISVQTAYCIRFQYIILTSQQQTIATFSRTIFYRYFCHYNSAIYLVYFQCQVWYKWRFPLMGTNNIPTCPYLHLDHANLIKWKRNWIKNVHRYLQYIPRNMHTVFALLCFVVVIHWLIFPYPSGLLHWHCGNLTIALVPAKQPLWIWINTPCEFIMNDCITTTNQSTTKPCAYFLGYTVCERFAFGSGLSPISYMFPFLFRIKDYSWSTTGADYTIVRRVKIQICCLKGALDHSKYYLYWLQCGLSKDFKFNGLYCHMKTVKHTTTIKTIKRQTHT